jgi:hypothetical protein
MVQPACINHFSVDEQRQLFSNTTEFMVGKLTRWKFKILRIALQFLHYKPHMMANVETTKVGRTLLMALNVVPLLEFYAKSIPMNSF